MEVIELPGYLLAEKVQIGLRHLVPKQIDRHGLTRKHIGIQAPVLRRIVREYTREAGVRGLEKCIQALCRKAAVAVASRRKPPGRIKQEDLPKLLGPVRFPEDARREGRVPGVVQGLAWTPHGGDVLYIEVAIASGKGGLTLTGSLGEVMSESCRIALGYLRSQCKGCGLSIDDFNAHDFHVHFPAGAIPKDGPSAGIAIASGLVSALQGVRVPQDVAMTGELTVLGEILPIGGVREKVLAAQRLGIGRVILPSENRRDVEELHADMVKGLEFLYVGVFPQVLEILFGGKARRRSARRGGA
jgi:ATP-dependent Lon protease